MKNYTFRQIQEIQKKQNYKHLGLFDQSGQPVINFNSPGKSPESRLKEIETRLNSEALPDGNYFVKGKNSPTKNVYTDDYLIIKGKAEQLAETMQPASKVENFSPAVLSYDNALKMQVENERLKLENANLLTRLEELENEIDEIQEKNELLSEEKTPSMLESGKAFLSEIVTMAAPLLDKHFELKEKALNLKAFEMQQRYTMPHKQASPEQAPQAKAQEHARRVMSVESWIESFKETPEQYEILANIYNSAQNQNDFIQTLEESAPDLFEEFINR
jgi:hypothetical protein